MFWYYPKIIEFLGYLPFETNGLSMGEKIVLYRKSKGISQLNFARQLGIDPSTLGRWEKGRGKPSEKLIFLLDDFFQNHFKTTLRPPESHPEGSHFLILLVLIFIYFFLR